MRDYGVYRAELSAEDDPYTRLLAMKLIIQENTYQFYEENGTLAAAYPINGFIVVDLTHE